jgi:hypothetical protein
MKLIHLILLVLLFLLFHFSGYFIFSWILGVFIILVAVSNLLSGTKRIAVGTKKELFRDMEQDMSKAEPKPPQKEYLTEIVKETGRKTGEFLAPEDFTYKSKGFWGRIGKGAKNFFSGLEKLFRK